MVDDLKEQTRKWLQTEDYKRCVGVTLTMKQRVNNVPIDDIRSYRNFRHFMNLLNKEVLGKKFTRFRNRIRVIPVLERSISHRYHYHTIFELPINVEEDEFISTLNDCWSKTEWGHEHCHHHSVIDEGWLGYITKTKTYRDEIDLVNLHWFDDRRV